MDTYRTQWCILATLQQLSPKWFLSSNKSICSRVLWCNSSGRNTLGACYNYWINVAKSYHPRFYSTTKLNWQLKNQWAMNIWMCYYTRLHSSTNLSRQFWNTQKSGLVPERCNEFTLVKAIHMKFEVPVQPANKSGFFLYFLFLLIRVLGA